jgi:hypothetical protein
MELAKGGEGDTGLGVRGGGWPKACSQQLNAIFCVPEAAAEVDGNAMESIGMDDQEILVAGTTSRAHIATRMSHLHT